MVRFACPLDISLRFLTYLIYIYNARIWYSWRQILNVLVEFEYYLDGNIILYVYYCSNAYIAARRAATRVIRCRHTSENTLTAASSSDTENIYDISIYGSYICTSSKDNIYILHSGVSDESGPADESIASVETINLWIIHLWIIRLRSSALRLMWSVCLCGSDKKSIMREKIINRYKVIMTVMRLFWLFRSQKNIINNAECPKIFLN